MTLPVADHVWHPLALPVRQTSQHLLLRSRLHCAGTRGETRLRLQYVDGRQTEQCLPVTRKGTLLEWVAVQGQLRAAWLLPSSQSLDAELQPVQLRWITQAEAQWRTWRRTYPMLYRQPRQTRQRIGLTAKLILRDWPAAYALAGALRDDQPLDDYQHWLQQFYELTSVDARRIHRQIRRWRTHHAETQPALHVVICHTDDVAALQRTRLSLDAQWFPARQVHTLPSGCTRVQATDAGWYVLLPAGTVLPAHALYWMAAVIRQHPALRWLYTDHDHLLGSGRRCEPLFKPDWSPTLLHSQNYIGWSGFWQAKPGDSLPVDGITLYQHWLKLGQQLTDAQIAHLPALLMSMPQAVAADMDQQFCLDGAQPCPVARHLANAKVQPQGYGVRRVYYPLPEVLPRVSVIIPTRNGLTHLQACLQGLWQCTDYPALEIIVVDNQSDDPATLHWLDRQARSQRLQCLRYDQPFNYSAINNYAVRHASGELICLLNNDTEVISHQWLREMVSHLLRPGVGVVGAKLYYSDGTIQHAGDAIGPGGCADHLHHRLPGDAAGYARRALCAQELSAVTGACLLTHKALYQQLGGLNAQDLPVAFNDVDYCLRVREAGQRVVWTPYAELYHHESVSRGQDETPERQARAARELAYMRRRWKQALQHDPFYNPNLSYDRPDFSLSKAPRVSRPWEA